MSLTALFGAGCLCELVEDVEVPLAFYLSHDTTFLQEVVRDLSADRLSVVVEHDF